MKSQEILDIIGIFTVVVTLSSVAAAQLLPKEAPNAPDGRKRLSQAAVAALALAIVSFGAGLATAIIKVNMDLEAEKQKERERADDVQAKRLQGIWKNGVSTTLQRADATISTNLKETLDGFKTSENLQLRTQAGLFLARQRILEQQLRETTQVLRLTRPFSQMTVFIRARLDSGAIDGGQFLATLQDARRAALNKHDLSGNLRVIDGKLLLRIRGDDPRFPKADSRMAKFLAATTIGIHIWTEGPNCGVRYNPSSINMEFRNFLSGEYSDGAKVDYVALDYEVKTNTLLVSVAMTRDLKDAASSSDIISEYDFDQAYIFPYAYVTGPDFDNNGGFPLESVSVLTPSFGWQLKAPALERSLCGETNFRYGPLRNGKLARDGGTARADIF